MKKLNLRDVKRLIKSNAFDLHIKNISGFDPLTDGLTTDYSATFRRALVDNPSDSMPRENTLGVSGAWFILQSRDYFMPYEDDKFAGIEVSNGCGRFILAVPKTI